MKRILVWLLLVVMALGMISCLSMAFAENEDYTIGVSLFYRRDEFYKDLENGMITTAEDLGVTLKIQDADADAAKQVDQFESFAAAKVDLIAAAICDPTGLIPTVNSTVESGIPVFTFDGSTTDNEGVTCFVGMDNYQAGVTAGEWVKQYVEEELGGTAKVAILSFPTSAVVCGARVEGFKSVLEGVEGIEIVAEQDGKASRVDSMAAMENILQANEKIDVVFGINDDTCFGAIAAIQSADVKDVAVISVGWSQEMFEMLQNKDPYFKASAVQNPYTMGSTTIKAIVEYLKTGEIEPEILDKAILVTQDTIGDYDWQSIIAMRKE